VATSVCQAKMRASDTLQHLRQVAAACEASGDAVELRRAVLKLRCQDPRGIAGNWAAAPAIVHDAGLKRATDEPSQHGGPSLRARLWKCMLGVKSVNASSYATLVKKCEHPTAGPKIRNDAFRTFKTCPKFTKNVPEARIIRVLNAFAYTCEKDGLGYVQGLNVLCGVFLYVMPELDAFACLVALASNFLPSYLGKNLSGVNTGCDLVEEVVDFVDPELGRYLQTKLKAQARIFAFAPLLTLRACFPSIDEVVLLWDILFSAGVHLNVVFFASQLILDRAQLLSGGPNKTQLTGREFPELDLPKLLRVALPILFRVGSNESLMARLEQHVRLETACS